MSPHIHAQGWREVNKSRQIDRSRDDWLEQFNAFEGILRAAIWGATIWVVFALLMICAWGVMA
jgi:hypothetical protein